MARVTARHRRSSGRRRMSSASWASPGPGSRRGRLLTASGLLGASVLTLLTVGLEPLQPTASSSETTLGPLGAGGLTAATAPASPGTVVPAAKQEIPDSPETRPSGANEWENQPTHIHYPAVGMDQAVFPLPTSAQDSGTGSITPPQTLQAYWLSAYGSPGQGSSNTTYVVGHSSDGVGSAFNNLSSQARTGDQLTITTADGPQLYQVYAISTENKNTLENSHIWAKVPGKLVLVSCYTADLWGTNILIEANPMKPTAKTSSTRPQAPTLGGKRLPVPLD
ncbi:class F sortase [Arthrobacter sp. ISL-48]|uniref:class F sortase n=1 Tax=Arthrobacter sp. ISL-48 TaxID=2819110 RepID=UPI001BEC89FB|nr:class F sortase [Arthrobacter sp. ISL-48]MBT2534299.1 class F sortase [Arthrobacter sp. ISL-48]